MLVGIGASAGGLEALKRLFSHLPQDSGLAYVVVMHLAPEQPSLLADLLQPHAQIPVLQVTEDTEVEPNHVYVIPPGKNLSTIDSHLRLSQLQERRRERAPIDYFFGTLAGVHHEHCAGVILSGTGSDGALGIRRIREHGGLTVVQGGCASGSGPADTRRTGSPERGRRRSAEIPRAPPASTMLGSRPEGRALWPPC
jgi:two-component system CheB/CheR fusion protein